jgi:hypothetical protein
MSVRVLVRFLLLLVVVVVVDGGGGGGEEEEDEDSVSAASRCTPKHTLRQPNISCTIRDIDMSLSSGTTFVCP